jgi:predicted AlkP superfamily phosphohydrolase/phosphomutase/tetratricopeptide (TPR) repeat protein
VSQRLAHRILLVGWDAADWQLIDPLLAAGQMPALAALLAGGVRAPIQTLNPIISPILWNSIATGKLGDKHGILGFIEPDGRGGVRPVSSTSRRAKAVWNILSQRGLRSTVLGWYASCPAERINGVVVGDLYQSAVLEDPETFALDERAIWPPRLIEPLADLVLDAGDITGETARYFVPEIASIDHASSPYAASLARLLAEAGTIHNAATYLLEHEPFDFMAVYYPTIDHFGHAFMEFHPPAMDHVDAEHARLYGGVMNAAYRYHDLMLARLLTLAGPDTTVILMSDHGFHSGALRPRIFVDAESGHRSGAGMNPVAWHRPYGIFAARGPGIRTGAQINGVTLLDICPTVLALLGAPVAEDMDGKPLLHMFERPPEVAHVPTYEGEHPQDGVHRGELSEDPYSLQEVMKQLVSLGYIESPSEDKQRMVESTIEDRRAVLGQILFSSGKYSEAERVLRDLIAEHPAPRHRSRLAMVLIEQERFDEAETILEGLAGDPAEAPIATLMLAQVRFGRGRFDEAAALLDRLVEHGIRLPAVYTQLGRVRLRQHRWADAERAYREGVRIDPDDADAHDGLGVALRNQGRSEEAVYHHMRAVSLDANRAVAHMNLGIALADLKQIDWAIRALETASELAPEASQPHRYLARLYAKAKKDAERARAHARRAHELRAQAAAQLREEAIRRGHW